MIEEILSKRTNHSFFREDKIPEKKVIEDILEQAHKLTPHKNNFYHYDVEVFGPEYDEEKKYVAMSTICSHAKHKYRKNGTKEDMKELEDIYDRWLIAHNNLKSEKDFKKMRVDFNKIHFNNQVRAPYLLVYSRKNKMITESQMDTDYFKSGKISHMFNINKPNPGMWLIQSGMHGIVTSMLAIDKGLDVSFCKCFFYNPNIHTNILRKAVKKEDDIAFILSIGYADTSKHQYKSWVKNAKYNEIVKWK